MNRHRFSVSISVDKWLSFYEGSVSSIVVRSFQGLRISIPVRNFIPHVTFSGIQGTFEIEFSAQNKIINMKKL